MITVKAPARGVPVVAASEAGPVERVKNCESGELVDVCDPEEIAAALHSQLI